MDNFPGKCFVLPSEPQHDVYGTSLSLSVFGLLRYSVALCDLHNDTHHLELGMLEKKELAEYKNPKDN